MQLFCTHFKMADTTWRFYCAYQKTDCTSSSLAAVTRSTRTFSYLHRLCLWWKPVFYDFSKLFNVFDTIIGQYFMVVCLSNLMNLDVRRCVEIINFWSTTLIQSQTPTPPSPTPPGGGGAKRVTLNKYSERGMEVLIPPVSFRNDVMSLPFAKIYLFIFLVEIAFK